MGYVLPDKLPEMKGSKEQQILRQQLWVSIYEKAFVEKPRDNAYIHANKAVEEFDKTFNNNLKSKGDKQ